MWDKLYSKISAFVPVIFMRFYLQTKRVMDWINCDQIVFLHLKFFASKITISFLFDNIGT